MGETIEALNRVGGERERVFGYLDRHVEAACLPSVRQIERECVCSHGAAQRARVAWKAREYDRLREIAVDGDEASRVRAEGSCLEAVGEYCRTFFERNERVPTLAQIEAGAEVSRKTAVGGRRRWLEGRAE